MPVRIIAAMVLIATLNVAAAAKETRATIVYDDVATQLERVNIDAGQLWITNSDLGRATGFVMKRQGVCREELCFPLPKSRKAEFVRQESGADWFSLSAFAQLVHQPFAHDETLATWYFALRSDQRQGLASLRAPNFTLPDMDGQLHSPTAFRCKQ